MVNTNLQGVAATTPKIFGVRPKAAAGAGPSDNQGLLAYVSSDQAIATATDTKITLDATTFDPSSLLGSNKITPTKAGTYMFLAKVTINALAGAKFTQVHVYKNGSQYVQCQTTMGVAERGEIILAGIAEMNGTTDYLELFVYHNHGSNRNASGASADTFLGVHRLGTTGDDYYVYANLTADQSGLTNNSHTKIALDEVVFDPQSDFDTATNNRYTPTKAGTYLVIGNTDIASVADAKYAETAIYKNGSGIKSYYNNMGVAESGSSCAIALVSMNGTTDYLELFARHNHGSNRTAVHRAGRVNYLACHRLGTGD